MTAPEDDLEQTLRRALSAAVGPVEPGADGLERIRGKIGTRPPRAWLPSVAFGLYERVRNWTWRGHWAWPDALAAHAVRAWPRLLRLPRPASAPTANRIRTARVLPPAGGGWLRPVAVLAGIAVIACISIGVQPFRQAIIQASNSVLTGGGQHGGAGTDGSGTPAGTGNGASAAGRVPGGATSPGHGGTARRSGSPTPTSTATARCAKITAELTDAPPTATANPSTAAPTPSAIPSALPYSPTPSCLASVASATPSPTVSSGSPASSPTPSTSGASPTTSATPTATPTATDTPTPTATPTATDTPTDSPSGGPTPTDSASGAGTDTPGVGSPTAPVS